MKTYLELLQRVMAEDTEQTDRTGVGTRSIFGAQVRYPLAPGFPLVTTKKVHWKSVVHELLWFIRGETNIRYLNEHKVSIWDEWADSSGDLGRIYGAQWTDWRAPNGQRINQLENLVKGLRANPHSRRHIVSAWNPGELDQMALPPCHALFQFHVNHANELSCQLYQRSADLFLGVPFNIASYALLTLMVAQVCHLKPKEFIHTFGDLHIYKNHYKQVEIQLARSPRPLPTVCLDPAIQQLSEFNYESIELKNYDPHPLIKAPIAV